MNVWMGCMLVCLLQTQWGWSQAFVHQILRGIFPTATQSTVTPINVQEQHATRTSCSSCMLNQGM